MEVLAYIAFYSVIVYLIIRFKDKQKPEPQKPDDLRFFDICENVRKLNALTEQLQGIENMICDIEICNADHLKAVRIEIPESLSHNSSHEMIINGEDVRSQYLLQLALSERDRLRSSLLDEIEKIHRSAVTQTVTQSSQNTEQDKRGESLNAR